MSSGLVWRGAWGEGVAAAAEGPLVLFASWARGEPERGRYDDAELASWRKAAVAARRRSVPVWVVVHAGALPDWQIAREGWLDPDALANWGCWVDRLGRALLEAVDGWVALWDPIAEASWYEGDARRVGRVLLDAQAAAYLQLHRGAGAGGTPVGAAVSVEPPGARGVRGRVLTRAHRWATEAWVRAASTGRLEPPFALTGELPNGTSALDVVVVMGTGDATALTTGRRVIVIGEAAVGGADVLARIAAG